ncbi:hypothetical protein TrVE_jg1568 [Triparma verrucosa]|uniref:PPC domain-containing protein n=2 Tax=Triparma TaxID=722752 RepID=A0A9W7ALA2_9STRA|nr:hypothetical protein TrST_g8499 [Triparma strigata]GMI14686.1 hypothetical protein TrVE_jg1568 [Triparma verrucosa]
MIPPSASSAYFTAFRFPPNTEIYSALKETSSILVDRSSLPPLSSTFITTAVGSVHTVTLRLANATSQNRNCVRTFDPDERFEVLSLVGTICEDGSHLHVSLGDKDGKVWGGHLISATTFTTLEVVLGAFPSSGIIFKRPFDEETGFGELKVQDVREEKKVDLRGRFVAGIVFGVGMLWR